MKKILLFFVCLSLFAGEKPLPKKTYNALTQANSSIKNKNYANAIDILKKLKPTTDQENIYVYTLLSDAYLGKLNYDQAAINLEKLLKISSVKAEKRSNTVYNLLQIYLAQKKYKKVDFMLSKYKNITISPKLYANIALSYLKLKKYNKSLTYIKKALSKEPRNQDFMQILIAIYSSQNNQSELCATIETAHNLKILKNSFVKQLVYCLYKKGAPLRGARVLQKSLDRKIVENSFKNKKLLFNLLFEAKEYEKALQVAKNIHDVKSSLLIAQALYNKGEYDKTIHIANSFKFKDSSMMKLMEAQSYYYKKNFKKAKEIFQKCLNYPSVAQSATSWLNFMEQ